MEAGKHQIYPQIRLYDRQKTNRRDHSHLSSLPSANIPRMKINGIDKPGDERPRLFGVPTPIGAPGAVRPNRSGDDTAGKEGPSDGDHAVGHIIELVLGRHILLQQVLEPHALRPYEAEQPYNRRPADESDADRGTEKSRFEHVFFERL